MPLTLFGQGQDCSFDEELTQKRINEIVDNCTSLNVITAIENLELLYNLGVITNSDQIKYLAALQLARKYFFLIDLEKRDFWEGRALAYLGKQAEKKQSDMIAYHRFTDTWNDSTDQDRSDDMDMWDLIELGTINTAGWLQVLSNLNDPKLGVKMCKRLLNLCKEHHEEKSLAAYNAYIGMAKLYFSLGKKKKSLAHLYKAFDIQEEVIYLYLPRLLENDRLTLWQRCFGKSFNCLTLAELCKDKREMFDLACRAYDQQLLTKGVLLNTYRVVHDLVRKDSILSQKWDRLYLERKKQASIPLGTEERATSEVKANLLERSVVDCILPKLATKELVSCEKVRAILKEDELAVEFLTIDDDYYALMLCHDLTFPIPVYCGTKEDVERLNAGDITTSVELFNKVWRPILGMRPNTNTIYFSPSDLFNVIPIEYCMTDNGEFMHERIRMFRLSSTREILLRKAPPEYQSVAIYGGIDYDTDSEHIVADARKYNNNRSGRTFTRGSEPLRNWKSSIETLPYSSIEADIVDSTMNNPSCHRLLLKGADATESSFKDLSGHSPQILHLATHGFYWTEDEIKTYSNLGFLKNSKLPLVGVERKALSHSGILFAGAMNAMRNISFPDGVDDGICTAEEISHLDLTKTDLVVLSACNSGLGDIRSDGIFGLQRGFKKAGVNSILMSLWPVNDNATMLLMTWFYSALDFGVDKTDALSYAQRCLRKYNNGYYSAKENWAGFILVDALYEE